MANELFGNGRIGNYVVGDLVETTDSAHVLHARNEGLDLDVTVHLRKEDSCPEKFRESALITAILSHQNVRMTLDGSFSGDRDLVVLARCEDRLSDCIERGDLNSLLTLKSCSQILEALDYAHRKGVYHGALSSKNVFYRDGQVNVGGFTGRGSLDGISDAEKYDVCSVGTVLGEMFAGLKPEERLEWLEQIALDSASGKYSSAAEMRNELDRRLIEHYSKSVEERTESFFERGARLAREISGLIRYLGKSKE